jgi:hypothetical protein
MFPSAVIVLAIISGLFLQSSSPPSPVVVEGTVTNKLTGAPIKEAHVVCMRAGSGTPKESSAINSETDAGGRFALQIEPGSYRLWVERSGFSRQAYGAHTADGQGTLLTVSSGQKVPPLTIQMSPYGVIAGRVLDEDGDPIQGASVQVLRFSYVTGQRELIPVYGTSTNDRGEYRAFGLPAGRYFLLATRYDGPYAPLYYPGVLDFAAASEVSLPEGAEADGTDFQLQKFRVVTVRGRILSPVQNFADSQLQVVLAHRDGDLASSSNRISAKVDLATGQFEFPEVAPGSYLIVASQLYGKLAFGGRVALEIRNAAPPDRLIVPLTSGFAVDGTVQTENGARLPSVTVELRPAEGLAMGEKPVATSSPTGHIRLSGITPGVWDVIFGPLPENYCVQSATLNEIELLHERLNLSAGTRGEIRILLADNCPSISGTVVGPDGQPHNATVVLAPVEPELRRSPLSYRAVVTQNHGVFAFKGVHPGSYKLFALEEVEPLAWMDPQLLEPVDAKGELVSVAPGDQATRQLVLIPADALSPQR